MLFAMLFVLSQPTVSAVVILEVLNCPGINFPARDESDIDTQKTCALWELTTSDEPVCEFRIAAAEGVSDFAWLQLETKNHFIKPRKAPLRCSKVAGNLWEFNPMMSQIRPAELSQNQI